MAKSCTKLTVLKLSKVCITSESATKLIDIFVQFQDLRVLVFAEGLCEELRSNLPYFVESAISKLTKLESLLGVTSEEIDLIPSLKYKSGQSVKDKCWHILQQRDNDFDLASKSGEIQSKRRKVSMWVPVKDKVTLRKAQGTDFSIQHHLFLTNNRPNVQFRKSVLCMIA